MAAEYAHTLLALRGGEIVAAGTPKEILSTEMIRDVFGIDSHVMNHPVTGQPMCLPVPGASTTDVPPVVAPAPA
jgi:iron complex transport system ATP-binding protein